MRNRKIGKGMVFLLMTVLTVTTMPVSGFQVSAVTVSENSGIVVTEEKLVSEEQQTDDNLIAEQLSTEDGLFTYVIIEAEDGSKSITITGCNNKDIETVVIPNEINGVPVICIKNYTFEDCKALTRITIPASVTDIGYRAFHNCSALTSISVSENNTVYDSRDNCNAIIETQTNTLIKGCNTTVIPEEVTNIEDFAFAGCSGLTVIILPQGVERIGGYAFAGCSGLTSISIPASVSSIEGFAFSGCSELMHITVEEGNEIYDSRDNCNAIMHTETNCLIVGCKNTVIPESATSICSGAFSGCSELSSIVIPNGITNIGWCAFENCSALTSINIPSTMNSIGWGAFMKCSGLTNVVIPLSVTSIEDDAFYGCSALTSITIPSSVTSISEAAFWECNGLINIKVAEENTVYDSRNNCNAIIETATNTLITGCKKTVIPQDVTIIGDCAFYSCSGLTNIVIPPSVKSIGEQGFICCDNLTNIEIPSSVTSIGESAFSGCYNIENIYYTGSEEQWKNIIIGEDNSSLTNAIVNNIIHFNCSMPSQTEGPSDSGLSKQAADAAIDVIKAIGTVTLEKKTAIDKARAAYDALADSAKKYVSAADLKILTDAETKYAKLVADKAAADKAAAEKTAEEAAKKAAAEEAAKKAAAEAAKKEAVGAENVVGDATYVVAKDQTVIYKAPVKKDVTSVKIPETIKINDKDFTVTEIAAGAFKNNKKLTKVTISKNIKVIDKNAFYGCSTLRSVTIGSKVTTIGDGAFQGCSKLTKVTIPAKVTKIGKKAFYNCKKLKNITIKTGSLKSVGKSAFKKIAKKASIKVPKKKLTAYKKLLKGKTEADTKIKK